MSTRRQRLSRRTASRMLDDPTAYADAGGLGAALSAATRSADATPHGEDEAATVFRAAARQAPVPTLGGTSAMTRFTRRLAAAPVAALATAGILVAGGGVALAASQGAVHVPFTGHDNRPADVPSATSTVNPGVGETHAPSGGATEGPAASATASPSPSLEGLCVAFQAGAMDKAASNPAFTALQDAAGGTDGVDAYCTALIGASTHPTHPALPTQAATPVHPTTGSTHRQSQPTDLPTPTTIPEEPSRAAH